MLWFIFGVIALAFIFDFINGFHDAANSIATIVATGILKPIWAVIWAAFFNFIAFLVFHLSVANTIGAGLITTSIVDPFLIFAALSAAIIWNLVTWYYGLPSSSSHALIGGLVGAGLAKGGTSVLIFSGLSKVLLAIVLSPLLGLIISSILVLVTARLTHYWSSEKVKRRFGYVQLVSAAGLSLTHGGNDAQKTMGIIALLLFSAGFLDNHFSIPFWIVFSCNLVMGLGTLAGGWRIIDTMGKKITNLNPMTGSCAEGGAAITLFIATEMGIPVSTTHTITGAITGVGVHDKFATTQWNTIRKIVLAWIFTLPIAAVIAAFFELVLKGVILKML